MSKKQKAKNFIKKSIQDDEHSNKGRCLCNKMEEISCSSLSIEMYGKLVSDSLKIDANSLNTCLDDIIRLFESYFSLINKVAIFKKFNTK